MVITFWALKEDKSTRHCEAMVGGRQIILWLPNMSINYEAS